MSCKSNTKEPQLAETMPPRCWWRRPIFVKTVVAFHEAFQEALRMRRAAHRRRPFYVE
jgi:hypothetical protein